MADKQKATEPKPGEAGPYKPARPAKGVSDDGK
jgi:hypothetical protein